MFVVDSCLHTLFPLNNKLQPPQNSPASKASRSPDPSAPEPQSTTLLLGSRRLIDHFLFKMNSAMASQSLPEWRTRQSTSQTDPQARNQKDTSKQQTCRHCRRQFQTRNKLMRHLFKSHPPPDSSASTTTRPPVKRPGPKFPVEAPPKPATPRRAGPQVHPFALLSHDQQLALALYMLYILFVAGLKQREQERKEDQGDREMPISVSCRTERDQTQTSQMWNSVPGTASEHALESGKLVEESDLEDFDEGGVAVSEPALAGLVPPTEKMDVGLEDLNELGLLTLD